MCEIGYGPKLLVLSFAEDMADVRHSDLHQVPMMMVSDCPMPSWSGVFGTWITLKDRAGSGSVCGCP
jgi:hypothetical protein